jgi:2-dehydropantoate 2-reductase
VKLTVFGTGGVGGYFGGRLALAGADVHLIARGAHLEALRARGLKVTSTKGDFHVELPASDDPTDIGPCDYVLFPVKSFDTDAAAGRLGPLIGERTAVLSVQNGIDDEDNIARAVGRGTSWGCRIHVLQDRRTRRRRPYGRAGAHRVREMDGSLSERAQDFLDACRKADIDAELADGIVRVLWDKFAFICAQAGMTAAASLPIGDGERSRSPGPRSGELSRRCARWPQSRGSSCPGDIAEPPRAIYRGPRAHRLLIVVRRLIGRPAHGAGGPSRHDRAELAATRHPGSRVRDDLRHS